MYKNNLHDISKYRTELMGIAAMLIVICHAPLYSVQMHEYLKFVINFGNVGVDVFLFLSGVGCFYSLSNKGGINNLPNWYGKRYSRILLPYAIMQIPYWGYYILINQFDLKDFLFEFSTLAFWFRHTGMWFIALLVPLYLVTPIIYKIINSESAKHRYIKALLLIIFILLVCDYNFNVGDETCKDIVENLQWAFVRIISFIIGLAIGQDVIDGKRFNIPAILIVSVVSFCTLRLLNLTYHWCVFPIIILLSLYICKCVYNKNGIHKFITLLGICSLEIYISNGYIRYMFIDSPIFHCDYIIFYGHYFDYFIIFILSLGLSIVVNKLTKVLIQNCNFIK